MEGATRTPATASCGQGLWGLVAERQAGWAKGPAGLLLLCGLACQGLGSWSLRQIQRYARRVSSGSQAGWWGGDAHPESR